MSEYYMGIDLSLAATGIVVIEKGVSTPAYQGVIETEPHQPLGERLHTIAEGVTVLLNAYKPEEYCAEGIAGNYKGNGIVIVQVHGAVRAALWKSGRLPPYYAGGSTLKKFVTGNGRGEKSDIKMGLLEKWGARMPNNNEADAYGLAKLAEYVHAARLGKFPADANERECVKTVLKSSANWERQAEVK